jgi:thymidylate synthase (FAD)
MLNDQRKVLSDGLLRVISVMGGDSSVVQAARTSYGAGTKKVHEDRGLIRYLMRHHHTSPFEFPQICIHVRCPISVARQWMRHRLWSFNEYSTRYSEAIGSAELPTTFRAQSTTNKQGSSGVVEDQQLLRRRRESTYASVRQTYERELAAGVAREQARDVLPLGTYTEFYATVDLHNLLHFIRLRSDSHAQAEIRAYSDVLKDIVHEWCPITAAAFEDYVVKGITLSRAELSAVNLLLGGQDHAAQTVLTSEMTARERQEFAEKLPSIRGKLSC